MRVPEVCGAVSLLPRARALLAQAERLHEDLAGFADGIGGHVRLLGNTNALAEFLPEVLGRFLTANPGTSVDIEERLSDEIVGLVAQGTADLGIVAGTVDTGALHTIPFRVDRFVIVARPGDGLSDRRSIAFGEVLDRDFVGLDRVSAIQRFLADRALRAGRRLRSRVQLRSFDTVCLMVQAGVGIGVVPETTARRVARAMGLIIVPLEDAWARRDLRICARDPEEWSNTVCRLVAHMQSAAPPSVSTP